MVVIAEQNVNVINLDNIKAKIKLKEHGKKKKKCKEGAGKRGKGLIFSSQSKIKSID